MLFPLPLPGFITETLANESSHAEPQSAVLITYVWEVGTKLKLQRVFCTQQEEVKPGAAAEPDAKLQLPDNPPPPGPDHVPANQTDALQVGSLLAHNHF